MPRPLNKPKNYHYTVPRCCETCRRFMPDGDGAAYCTRDPEGLSWDIGDKKFLFHVCDYWEFEG